MPDIGKIVPDFVLSNFEIYPVRDYNKDWQKHIDKYNSLYGTEIK